MKRKSAMIAAALMLCLALTCVAEECAEIEVIRIDGISVVVLTPESEIMYVQSPARGAVQEDGSVSGLVLPKLLMAIGEEAFAGIGAETVEVTENVASIGYRAFADCKSLKKITIPATVQEIDDRALEGCRNVTVYGEKGSEAERFVKAANAADPDAGFVFVPLTAEPVQPEAKPVTLPFVPA